jgi:hypothetical protein
MIGAVKAWIEAHSILNGMLVGALFLGLLLAWILLLLSLARLLRPRHIRRFLSEAPPPLRLLKFLGQEIQFSEQVMLAEQASQEALKSLDDRLTRLEGLIWTKVLPALEDEDEPDLGL